MLSAELTNLITKPFAVALKDTPDIHSQNVGDRHQLTCARQIHVGPTPFANQVLTTLGEIVQCVLAHPVIKVTPS